MGVPADRDSHARNRVRKPAQLIGSRDQASCSPNRVAAFSFVDNYNIAHTREHLEGNPLLAVYQLLLMRRLGRCLPLRAQRSLLLLDGCAAPNTYSAKPMAAGLMQGLQPKTSHPFEDSISLQVTLVRLNGVTSIDNRAPFDK